jgi:hypothetical protein
MARTFGLPGKALLESQTTDKTQVDRQRIAALPLVSHLLIAGCLVTMVVLARYASSYYTTISHEDHVVEWASVVFYLTAAFIGLRYAIRQRRVFDGLVALYCLFNGGEEFSWGQRLLGFSPPKYFMEANIQQEINIHNLFRSHTHDIAFAAVVAGYFVLLPLFARYKRSHQLLEKIGATAPPTQFAPWAIFLIILHNWHPFHLSSEWYETIVAGLFLGGSVALTSRKLTSKAVLITVSIVFAVSVGLTNVSNAQERRYTPERVACAKAEVQNLLEDLIYGKAVTEKLEKFDVRSHRRIFLAQTQHYLSGDRLTRFNATRCKGLMDPDTELRHRYAVDPWGLSYWLYAVRLPDGSFQLTVYSFGPNRRRDSAEGTPGASDSADDDDIGETGILMSDIDVEQQTNSAAPPIFSLRENP